MISAASMIAGRPGTEYDIARFSVVGLRPEGIDIDSHELGSREAPSPEFTISESLVQGLGSAAGAVFGNAYPDPNQVRCFVTAVRFAMDKAADGVSNWMGAGRGERMDRRMLTMSGIMARRSLPWANLMAGEALALVPQGLLQNAGANTWVSLGTFLATSLGIEIAASTPIAIHNERRSDGNVETDHDRRVRKARAVGEAFWLGGAWGVERGRLNRREMHAPILGYMVFGTGLGAAAELNDLAATLIESPEFYAGLLALASIRTFNNATGLEGFMDRMADRTARFLGHIVDRFDLLRRRPGTGEVLSEHAVQE
jgi:hypothetical protein